ncbi:MAG: hypothetical protein HC878_18625 [Leptolyngbyaceae cyanobacterium SL_5_14]|nr:hypothetical protein [Leptolyngbyaceae cyanobacterium SL_5_14]
MTFDQLEDSEGFEETGEEIDGAFVAMGIRPAFGNLHPLEGLRPSLYEEEAIAVLVALIALHRFFSSTKAPSTLVNFPCFPAVIAFLLLIPNPKYP